MGKHPWQARRPSKAMNAEVREGTPRPKKKEQSARKENTCYLKSQDQTRWGGNIKGNALKMTRKAKTDASI